MSTLPPAAGLREAPGADTVDVHKLQRWMQEHIAGFSGVVQVHQFAGGQSNPTFLVQTADQRYVLRRKPLGKLLPSAHALDREFRVLTALKDTDVPVARAFA